MSSKFEIKFEVSPEEMRVTATKDKEVIFVARPTLNENEFSLWHPDDDSLTVMLRMPTIYNFGDFLKFLVRTTQADITAPIRYIVQVEGIESAQQYLSATPNGIDTIKNGYLLITRISVYGHGVRLAVNWL